MTISYNTNSFDWLRFCVHYESEVMQKYQKTPSVAADKINNLRTIHHNLQHTDIEPDALVELLMKTLPFDRGEIAAFCDPERIEEPDNLIEGYEWCVSTLSDNTVPREIRSFCAAQVGDFDEMLQEEEIEI